MQGIVAHLIQSDNLREMRGMDTDSVDLICTDPPFNSGRNYGGFVDTTGPKKERFGDVWRWDNEAKKQRLDLIRRGERKSEEVHNLYKIASDTLEGIDLMLRHQSERAASSIKSYLTFMAPRLVEMRRVLKEAGCIYLHCDASSNSYLRLLMDGLFNARKFREIIWYRHRGAHNALWGCVHDTILFYGDRPEEIWEQAIVPLAKR